MKYLITAIALFCGFIAVLMAVFVNNNRLRKGCLWFVEGLFLVHIACYFIRVIRLLFPPNASISHVLYLGFQIPYSFYAGCLLGYLVIKKPVNLLSTGETSPLLLVMRLSLASLYFFSSIAAVCSFQKSLEFFELSGYGRVFLIGIILLEFICAAGLLFKKTARLAALVLTLDMLGAVYTHFHNYISKGIPQPLINSLPALLAIAVLLSVLSKSNYRLISGLRAQKHL